jgi:dihydroxyacetone kinase-like protein
VREPVEGGRPGAPRGAPDPGSGVAGGIRAAAIERWLERFADLVDRDRDHLTELDAAIGDADHGLNMARGMTAVRARLAALAGPDTTPASLCREAAMTLISTVGGAAGPLYGTFLLRLGGALDAAPVVDPAVFTTALRAGVDGVAARGHAEAGDKTMLDAMLPAVAALEAGAVGSWPDALRQAASAAAAGSDATIPLVARKGRASYLGERSAGHRDPGAASSALLFEALATALADAPPAEDR